MTALLAQPVCVGWGIASALAPSARHTGFYLRAGRNNFSRSPFVDSLGDAVTVSCATTLPRQLVGADRLAALAGFAIEDALSSLANWQAQRVRICLTLPTRYAGESATDLHHEGRQLVATLAELPALRGRRVDVVPFPFGGAAGARAAIASSGWLASGEVDFVILVGVDTYYDWRVLEGLAKQDRLLTPDNIDGLRPGEAAACLLLTGSGASHSAVCRIVGAGEGLEPSQPGVDEPPNMAHGFTTAVRQAVEPLRASGARANYWFSDMTHENYRIREFQILMGRFGDVAGFEMNLQTPARELGEVGAATLPLYVALAAEAWYRGYGTDDYALCLGASDDGARGALLVQKMKTGKS